MKHRTRIRYTEDQKSQMWDRWRQHEPPWARRLNGNPATARPAHKREGAHQLVRSLSFFACFKGSQPHAPTLRT
jgi:hypothetical protein